MAETLRRTIVVDIRGQRDVDRLNRAMRELVGEGYDIEDSFDEAGDGVKRFGRDGERSLNRVGREAKETTREVGLLGRGFGALKGAVLGYLSIQAAQSLARGAAEMFNLGTAVEETAAKFGTTFGPAARQVDAFLDEFANMAGLTRQQGREITATLGAMSQGFGLSQEGAAGFSEEVVRLAADLSSFNNVPIEQTLQAIQSGLIGEQEPLRRFGILLSAATVEAEALEMRAAGVTGELSEQEKVMARLSLITENAGVAIGDLARTQESAQNQARRLSAEFREMADELATQLLPTFGFMLDLLSDVADGSDEAADSLAEMVASGFHEAVTEGIVLIRTLLDLGASISSIADAVPGVNGALGIMGMAWQRLITMTQHLTRIFYGFGAALAAGREGLLRVGQAAASVVGQNDLAAWFQAQAEAAGVARGAYWEAALTVGEATDEIRARSQEAIAATAEVYSAIGELGEVIGPDLSRILGGEGEVDTSNLDRVNEILGDIQNNARAAGEALKMPEALNLSTEIERLGREVQEMWEGVVEAIESADIDTTEWGALQEVIREVDDAAAAYADTLADIELREQAGAITAGDAAEERRQATEAHRAALTRLYDQYQDLLDAYPGLADALREAFDAAPIEATGDSAASLSDKLQSVADGARGVLRIADAMGALDDQTRQALDSVIDLADGLAGIIANPADVGSWVQALGGFVGTLQGLFGESPEARAARRELQAEIRDNIRQLERNTDALREVAQQGTDVDESTATVISLIMAAFQAAFEGAPDTTSPKPGDVSATLDGVEELFQRLLDLGFEEDLVNQYRDLFNQLIESGLSPRDALDQILNGPDGMLAVFGDLLGSLGEYADTVEGQIARIRDAQRFLGVEGEDALDQFLQSLLDNVDELAPEAQALLADLLALDRGDFETDEDYQQAVQALVAELYQLGTASGLSFDALEAMLDAILNFAAGVQAAGDVIGDAGFDPSDPSDPASAGGGETGALDLSVQGVRLAFERIREMLEYNVITLDEALDQLLAVIQSAAEGGVAFEGIDGNTLLDSLLEQIAGLDLTTDAGQQRLAEIIAQLYTLGPAALGLDPRVFEDMLDELQSLGGQFETGALVGGGDGEGSNAFRVSRTITEFQANQMLDVLRAILYTLREGLLVSAAPQPQPPALPRPPRRGPLFAAPVGPASRGSASGFDFGAGIDGEVVIVQRGRADALADEVYPHVIRRAGRELRRTYGNR